MTYFLLVIGWCVGEFLKNFLYSKFYSHSGRGMANLVEPALKYWLIEAYAAYFLPLHGHFDLAADKQYFVFVWVTWHPCKTPIMSSDVFKDSFTFFKYIQMKELLFYSSNKGHMKYEKVRLNSNKDTVTSHISNINLFLKRTIHLSCMKAYNLWPFSDTKVIYL